MSKQRMINTRFWNDGYVSNLTALQKLLFLYFLTNEHTNMAGIYELPIKIISVETGIGDKDLIDILPKLEGKVYYIDGWVFVKNFTRHQNLNSKFIQIAIDKAKKLVPRKILIRIKEIEPEMIIKETEKKPRVAGFTPISKLLNKKYAG